MSFITRGSRAAARPLRQTTLRNTPRRNASSHDHHHDTPSESAHHVAGGTGTEGFGAGFYVTIAAVPLLYLTYQLSGSKDNVIERYYRDYQAGLASKEARDVLHTTALEQAISDRALIYGASTNHSRDLRYTEFFNAGSPWNVAAGEGTADLRKLAQHYDEQKAKLESERQERMSAREKQ